MAEYSNDYYEQVDQLFDTIKNNPFVEKDAGNAVPQEEPQIQPVGWVENADATDGEPTVIIDADGIEVRDGKISVMNSAGADFINNPSADVLINSSGITITNGALAVSNPGGTVIIDGTSNMFKIVASGSMSLTVPVATAGTIREDVTTVTLSGLGTQTTIPAFTAFIASSLSATDYRLLARTGTWLTANPGYVANSSGGSPTRSTVAKMTDVIVGCRLNGSNIAQIRLASYSTYTIQVTFYSYYHIFKEAAL
jgi:hypothetical protein